MNPNRALSPFARIALVTTALLSLPATGTAQGTFTWAAGQGLSGLDFVATTMTAWDADGPGPQPPVLVMGGDFTIGGTANANFVATYEPVSRSWSSLGTGTNAPVKALVATPSGLVAGGLFTFAGSTACAHVAIWNGTNWAPLGSGLDGPVWALAVAPNGDVFAGGSFSIAGGSAAANIARWNGSTWAPLGLGTHGAVTAIALAASGDIYAGGQFDKAGGAPASNVARWDGNGWAPLGTGTDSWVNRLAILPNGNLIAGGSFSLAGGVAVSLVASWNGTSWQSLGAPPFQVGGTQVHALTIDGAGDLVVGGSLNLLNPSSNAFRWNGTSWATLPTLVAATVYSLFDMPGLGLVVGDDVIRSTDGHRCIGTVTATGIEPLGAGTDHEVRTITVLRSGEAVYGGEFHRFDGVAANGIVRRDNSTFGTFGSGIEGAVRALCERQGGDLVAGGTFATAGTVAANNLAQWNGSAWSAIGGGTNGAVRTIVELANGDLVLGGSFTTVGNPPVVTGSVARWNGTAWTAMGTNLYTNHVNALLQLPNGDLIAAGDFQYAGNVARWYGTYWSTLGGGSNGPVEALVLLPDGRLLAGGAFTQIGGIAVDHVAVFDGTNWSSTGNGPDGPVHALAVLPTGEAIACGDFTHTAGLPAHGLARLTGQLWLPVWSYPTPELFGTASALATLPSGDILLGGDFPGSTNGAAFHAQLSPLSPATAIGEGLGCVGAAGTVTLAADNLPWLGTTFRSTTTGMPGNSLAIVVRGLGATSLPLAAVFPQAGLGCELLVLPDLIDVAIAAGGSAATQFDIPNASWLVGASLREQVVPFEFASGSANVVGITSSNALLLTIGSL